MLKWLRNCKLHLMQFVRFMKCFQEVVQMYKKGGEEFMAKVYFIQLYKGRITYAEFIAKNLPEKLVAQVEQLIDDSEMEYLRDAE